MVIWPEPAIPDLRHIHDYIAEDSPPYAKKVASDLVARTEALGRMPRMGRVVPELNDPDVRELTEYSYRIIYEVRGQDIAVLAVIHSRRLLRRGRVKRAR